MADHPVNVDRSVRRAIGLQALGLIAASGVEVSTVARRGNSVRPAYVGMLAEIEARLSDLNGLGIVIVDGQDEDETYWSAHRDLPLTSRRVIEDPWMQPSHASQLIQMADFVAYAAHQHIVRRPGRQAMWGWYTEAVLPIVLSRSAGEDGITWPKS
jgi:Protein of unknown function (DUF3800)